VIRRRPRIVYLEHAARERLGLPPLERLPVTEYTEYGFVTTWPTGRRDAAVMAAPAVAHTLAISDGLTVVDGLKFGHDLAYLGTTDEVHVRVLPVIDLPWADEAADEFADAFAAFIGRLPKQAQLGAFALFLMAFATGGKEFGESISANPDAEVAFALLGAALALVLWPRSPQD
jgi:hypothetical protein